LSASADPQGREILGDGRARAVNTSALLAIETPKENGPAADEEKGRSRYRFWE
jgi:hypothetical protein